MHNYYIVEAYDGEDWFYHTEKWKQIDPMWYEDFDKAVESAKEYTDRTDVRTRVIDRCYVRTLAEVRKGEVA